MNIVKLVPAYKSIIWGGNKLKSEYSKDTEISPLAETWELSFHKDGKTMLEDGRTLCDVVTEENLGENCKAFDFFPVLVKFIDAQDINGKKEFSNDTNSFCCFTCLDGEGTIGNMPIKKGESVFVPATFGDFVASGSFTSIITTIRKYYLKDNKIENDLGEIIAYSTSSDLDGMLKYCGLKSCK